jgi:hypothetical protein
MKAFGLELRKNTGIGARSLFADVDRVLSASGVTADCVGGKVQQQSVAHALQNMMQVERHFDVCCVRHCATLCGVCINAQRMAVYQSQHCVHWNNMLPDFRATLCAMVLDDFRHVLTAET